MLLQSAEHQPIYYGPNRGESNFRPSFVLHGTETANSLCFYSSFQSIENKLIIFSTKTKTIKKRTLIELKSNRCNDLNCSTMLVKCSEANPFQPARERPTKFGQNSAKIHKTQLIFVTFQLAVMF